MKIYIITVLFIISGLNLIAQSTPPTIQWQKSIGGSGVDLAYSIQQTYEGGYIMAGLSTSVDGDVSGFYSAGDYWVVKFDSTGNIQWQKCLGGNSIDDARSIQQTNDGGYIVAGVSGSNDCDVMVNHGWDDCWVVKLDTIGNIEWQKSLGGSGYDMASSVQQTNDGGYIVAGSTTSNDGDVTGNHSADTTDYWIVKLDTAGNIQWEKTLGGSNDDEATYIQQTNDGGYIVGGYSCSNDGNVTGHHGPIIVGDYWIVKLDTAGNILWQKSLGGTNHDWANSIQQTNDGGYIVAGASGSNDGDVTGHHGTSFGDYWVVKIDSAGNIQWQKSFGGTHDDVATSIKQTNDGGYVLAGCSNSNDGDITNHYGNVGTGDYWLAKIDTIGNIQWQKSFGGTNYDYLSSIQLTNEGGFIVAGSSTSNNGDVTLNHGSFGNYDYWIVKLSPPPLLIKGINNTLNITIYPNPSDRSFTVNVPNDTKYIKIIDFLGQEIGKRKVIHQTEFSFELIENGIYFVQVVTDKETITKKVVINK